MLEEGKQTFRYETFGDEAFWGDALQLHHAIQGSQFGGVGPGVSPKTALALGLKVDSEALPAQILASDVVSAEVLPCENATQSSFLRRRREASEMACHSCQRFGSNIKGEPIPEVKTSNRKARFTI